MQREKQTLRAKLTLLAVGTAVIGLAGCVDAYPPPPPGQYYSGAGTYSYYDYPNTYQYYNYDGRAYGGYSDDPNLRYDARNRPPDHTDDHNFHNRDDFDHWDY